jgi:predicted acetyltransferase
MIYRHRMPELVAPTTHLHAARLEAHREWGPLDRVLAVCAVDNVASAKTVERCGGVFEGIPDTRFGPARRYRIEL